MSLGIGLGIGLGIQYNLRQGGGPADAYAAAVIADGGTVESKACVKATFDALAAVNIPLYTEAKAYQDAVVADSGAIESFSCVRGTFIELNNVAT